MQDYQGDLAMESYFIILDAVGWDVWRTMNRMYFEMKTIEGSDDNKLDIFTKIFCQASQKNVASYFQWWGYKLTEKTLEVCDTFPELETDPLLRYKAIDHTTITDHGSCDEGWLPYGDSCFFLSEEQLTWYDSVEACNDAGGHLASCLSGKEAYFLHNKLKELNFKHKYFVGIDSM